MKKCWAESPEDRLTFRDIYNQLWEVYKPVAEAEEHSEEIPLESLSNPSHYGQNLLDNYGRRSSTKNTEPEIQYNSN